MTISSQVKQTMACLKGTQATLRIYSAEIAQDETSAVFREALRTTEEVIKDLEERLKKLEFEEPQY